MRVHHLNCGTMRPPGAALVCHVLLVESDAGLVLIDTGGPAPAGQPDLTFLSAHDPVIYAALSEPV
jgi:glyoxylase-like metal-dependent hydrolase (beta-lactamase superfamily II)